MNTESNSFCSYSDRQGGWWEQNGQSAGQSDLRFARETVNRNSRDCGILFGAGKLLFFTTSSSHAALYGCDDQVE